MAAGLEGFFYEDFAAGGGRDIGLDEEAPTEALLEIFSYGAAPFFADFGDDDLRPLLGKDLGDAGADAAPRSGDDGYVGFPVQVGPPL